MTGTAGFRIRAVEPIKDVRNLVGGNPVAIVGDFNATDLDANSTLAFSLVEGNGSEHNHLFDVDTNGTLRTGVTFDYETNATTLNVRVRATDELNATKEKTFVISVINVVEDLDQDGIEDFYDPDDDNDGYSDAEEIAYGSNPRDANSTANTAPQITLAQSFPDQLDSNGVFHISHTENKTHIIQVTATDVDGDDLNYSIYGWQDLHHFEINATNGKLSFKNSPDYESPNDHDKDGVYGIVLRVSDNKAHHDQPVYIWVVDENEAPYDFNSTALLNVLENQPVGTIVGQLSSRDSDINSTLSFSLVGDAEDNQSFSIDTNGTLRTAVILDYELNATHSIRAKVKDEQNASSIKNFTVQIINLVEDFDGDGIEDAHDLDNDNDGFSDVAEIAYGSDPWDADSIANAAPDSLILSNHTIMENQPAGTFIGQLLGTDPDYNSTLNYSRVNGPGDDHNQNFVIDQNLSLRTKKSFDYESDDHNLSIRIRVKDEHNASLVRVFTITLLDLNDTVIPPTTDHNHTQPPGDGNGTTLPDHNHTLPSHDGNKTESPDHNQSIAPLAPIVRTGSFSFDENGSYQFEGEILSGNYSSILEVGILIKAADNNVTYALVADFNGSTGTFSLSANELPDGSTFYFRAYALTTLGESLGTIRRIEVSDKNDTRHWWSSIASTRTHGWIIDSWMGDLLPYPNQWAYHRRLGWIYMSTDGSDGYWIWRQENGWLWTNSSTWPFLWAHESTGWLYLFPATQKAVFYDYSLKKQALPAE